jgi:uncharacterized protein (UPF0332 family)
MNEAQRELLLDARDSLGAAQTLLLGGYPGFAASRAYYTMFYVAEAFLEGVGLSFHKHAGVLSAFGREFARTRIVPVELHRILLEAQELRWAGDYGHHGEVTHDQAREVIEQARQFLEVAEQQIGPLPERPSDE